MVDKQIVAYLKLLHATFNGLVILFFLYQGLIGFRIRTARKSGGKTDFASVRRHRTSGAALTFLGITGFLAGPTVTYLDYGHILKYPLHFVTGSAIAVLIATTFLVSRQIRVGDSVWRNRHFIIGIFIISLYLIQALLGLSILL